MKLIVEYIITDQCTYSCKEVLCFEYESEEDFLCDFEQELDKAIKNNNDSFRFCNYYFHTDHFNMIFSLIDDKFTKILPDVYEFNKWFELNKKN